MTSKTYTLMIVHAHPDDESSSTGGLLRLAAEQGHTTILVTCTNGGYPPKPGHYVSSITYRERLTTLPGHGQLVDLR